jgi:hypothetical protein
MGREPPQQQAKHVRTSPLGKICPMLLTAERRRGEEIADHTHNPGGDLGCRIDTCTVVDNSITTAR